MANPLLELLTPDFQTDVNAGVAPSGDPMMPLTEETPTGQLETIMVDYELQDGQTIGNGQAKVLDGQGGFEYNIPVTLGDGGDLPINATDDQIQDVARAKLAKDGVVRFTEPTITALPDRESKPTAPFDETLFETEQVPTKDWTRGMNVLGMGGIADIIDPKPQEYETELTPRRFTHPDDPLRELSDKEAIDTFGYANRLDEEKGNFPEFYEPEMSREEKAMKAISYLPMFSGLSAGMMITRETGKALLGSKLSQEIFKKITPQSGGKIDFASTNVQNVFRHYMPATSDIVLGGGKHAVKFAAEVQPTAIAAGSAYVAGDQWIKRMAAKENGWFADSENFGGWYINKEGKNERYDADLLKRMNDNQDLIPTEEQVQKIFSDISKANLKPAMEDSLEGGKSMYTLTIGGEMILGGIWKLLRPNAGLMKEDSKQVLDWIKQFDEGSITPKDLMDKDPLFLQALSNMFKITGKDPKEIVRITELLDAPANEVNSLLMSVIKTEAVKEAVKAGRLKLPDEVIEKSIELPEWLGKRLTIRKTITGEERKYIWKNSSDFGKTEGSLTLPLKYTSEDVMKKLIAKSTMPAPNLARAGTTSQRELSGIIIDGDQLLYNIAQAEKSGLLKKFDTDVLKNFKLFANYAKKVKGTVTGVDKAQEGLFRGYSVPVGQAAVMTPLLTEGLTDEHVGWEGGFEGTAADYGLALAINATALWITRGMHNPRSGLHNWLTKGHIDSKTTRHLINMAVKNENYKFWDNELGAVQDDLEPEGFLDEILKSMGGGAGTAQETLGQTFNQANLAAGSAFDDKTPLTQQLADYGWGKFDSGKDRLKSLIGQ